MPIERVIKRDNSIVPFDRKRIENAIYAAARAVGNGEGRQWAETLSWAVLGILEERFGAGERPPHVEEIQDIVEEVLIKSGNPRVAKAYILYRQRRAETRETQRMLLDGIKLVEDYLQRADWRVNENSNMNYSLQGLNFYIASSIAASYWLQKVYPPEVQKAHTEGDFHIHDLGMLSTYTYYGKEVVLVKDDSGIQLTSFEKLYADSKEPEVALNETDGAFAKYPRNCFVLDKSGWTRVVRLIRKRRDRPMRFIKNRGGRSVIVTDNHPMLTQNGERVAADVIADQDALYTVDPRPLLAHEQLFFETEIDLLAELKQAHVTQFGRDRIYFNGVPIEEIDTACTDSGLLHTFTQNITRKIPLTAEVGYLVGFILAEGYLSYNARSARTISMTQKDAAILHTINRTLIALGAPGCVSVRPHTGIYELQVKNVFLRFLFEHIFRIAPGAQHKTLPVHVLRYNLDFVQGLLAGIIDGDGSIDGNGTCMMIRISARTLLEQMAYLLQLLGATPRDRNIEGAGTRRVYKGREIIQRFPLYGLSFRKTAGLNLPSTKFQNTDLSTHAWQDETRDEWHIVICNQQAEIPDHDIYDITTESGTLIVNGMWNHNCCGWDLQELLRVGFGGVPAKLESAPPKHLRTALGQLVNFFYTLQGESAGAQAVSSFDTLLAPFIRYDGLDYKAVKQAMQEFIFNINVPTRVGFQTPFTNITLDLSPSPLLRDQPVIIGGKLQEASYGEFQAEMDMINHAFAEVMLEGDAKGRVFSVDYASYTPIRENGKITLVQIGEYIDAKMAVATPMRIEENQAEVLDVQHLDIQTIGIHEGQVGWQQVQYLVRHPEDRLLKITTVGGFNVSVTPSHSVLTLDDGKIVACEAHRLKPGDYLLTPRAFDLGQTAVSEISLAHALGQTDPEGIYLHDARYQDGRPLYEIRTAHGRKPYNYKARPVPLAHVLDILDELDLSEAKIGLRGSDILISNTIQVNESLLEFLGYYVAEGSAERGKYGGISLGFNLDREQDLANRLAAWLSNTFAEATVREIPARNLVEIRVHSKLLRRIMLDVFGIANGVERQVPSLVFGVSDELKRAFLRGYLQGDAYKRPNSFFVSTIAPAVAYGVSTLLKGLGIAHTLTEYVRRDSGRKVYRINIWSTDLSEHTHHTIGKIPIAASGLEALLKTMLAQEPDYHDALGRKYRNSLGRLMSHYGIAGQKSTDVENARRILADAEQMGITIPPDLKSLIEADIVFLQIKTIEEQKTTTGMVYDFSTRSESFLANQILVHNTFPIPTYNITADFDWDNPMLEPIWRMTAKYGIPYFSNFINSDMKPEDARSMCPLHPDTPVLVRAGRGIFVRTIKDVYYTNQQKGTEYEILHNGKWLPAKLVASPSAGCLEISLENGARVTMDVRHEQIVKRAKGEPIELITADRIETGMYLPFNATPLTDPADNYEAGFAVGAFLGDGSYDGKGAILYSLNMADKEERVAQRIEAFFVGCGFNVSRHEQKDVVQLVRVGGSGTVAEDWVAQFIEGRNAFEKRIAPRAFQMGSRFLEGLLEGWYQTDGGNRGRIYTVSAGLADDFATLCSLLGKAYCLDRKGDNRNGRYGDSPVFTLKFHNRTSYNTHFFYEDGYWWYPVQHIAPVDYDGLVFCFVVDSPHHLFQLANGLVTHNCRLRLDNRELRKRGGGLFGANPLTGSIGVVTINMPRIGYLARNEADFMNRLARVMDIARTSLEIKRKLLELHTEQGLYPYSRFYLREVKASQGSYWSNHFSTIGLNGMNEACLNLLGQDIASPEGKAFAIRVLRFMRDRLAEYQEETGTLFNLEATPAEGASYRLAKADRQRYPDIITAGTPEVPYYTNSTHLPVGYTDDIFEALEHQDDLQVLYTGGTVLHGFLGEQIDDWRQARLLVRRIAENFHLPYYTLTPTFSICPVHGYIPGAHPFCPYEHTPEELERYGIETGGEQDSERQI